MRNTQKSLECGHLCVRLSSACYDSSVSMLCRRPSCVFCSDLIRRQPVRYVRGGHFCSWTLSSSHNSNQCIFSMNSLFLQRLESTYVVTHKCILVVNSTRLTHRSPVRHVSYMHLRTALFLFRSFFPPKLDPHQRICGAHELPCVNTSA